MKQLLPFFLLFFLVACETAQKKPYVDQSDPAAAAKDLGKTQASGSSDDAGDPEAHRKTVVLHADEFGRCYRPALKLDPKLQGEVTLTWNVDAAGNVDSESVVESHTSIRNKMMIECMLERLHTWKFDAGPKDSVSTLTYPFYFKP